MGRQPSLAPRALSRQRWLLFEKAGPPLQCQRRLCPVPTMAVGYLIRVATLHKPIVFAKCWCEASNSRCDGTEDKPLCLWWGSIFMTVGYIIYTMRCPTEIRRCGEPEDYVLEQFQLRNTVHLNSAAKECLAQFIFSPTENPKLQAASFHQEASEKLIWGEISPLQLFTAVEHRKYHPHPFDTSGAPDTTVIYKSYFVLLDRSRPLARFTSVTLLALGCGIFLLPSVDVFFKVIRKIVFGG